jgi:hypothetical protein|tara:strand:+ start:407 stop:511 length:105 start_codon:yes stop_codon:yes gene_type:complete
MSKKGGFPSKIREIPQKRTKREHFMVKIPKNRRK